MYIHTKTQVDLHTCAMVYTYMEPLDCLYQNLPDDLHQPDDGSQRQAFARTFAADAVDGVETTMLLFPEAGLLLVNIELKLS